MTKCKLLKDLLAKKTLSFALEAHDGVSARIVEEAGFEVIWASGLTIATTLGYRDNNELSWTQLSTQWEYMADATKLPILVDGDSGFGNFNNVRILVKKLCQIGIAGVSIEDKLFPKTNSFVGENHPLADIKEFCGKIKAGKDSQLDANFNLIARTEAFISGRGIDEALERAYAYEEAGADAILVHSKKSNASEIQAFTARWEGRAPLIIVPTKYAHEPTALFEQMGISLIIWANQTLRASVTAMQKAARNIAKNRSLEGIEMASVEELFALVNFDELRLAETHYLP